MTFTRPKSGPKVYVTRGPSGHTETFGREAADKKLTLLLGDAKLRVSVEGFIRKMTLDHSFCERWDHVRDFLSEMSGLHIDHLALDVTIAFWAAIVRERDALKAAKASSLVEAHAGVN